MRISVSQICSASWSFEEDVRRYAELGVPAIAVLRSKLAPIGLARAKDLLRASGLPVQGYGSIGSFSLHERERWKAELATAEREIGEAAELGSPTVTLLSGSGRGRPYPESEAAFLELLGPLLRMAERAGVTLVFEHNSPLRVDLGFCFTLHDALDLSEKVASPHFAVCCELNNAWVERHLYDDIRDRVAHIGLVQVNDFPEGTRTTPERAALGHGIIPLRPILKAFEAANYRGVYELEFLGPAVEKLGYEGSIRGSLSYLASL
jgi:sugar phosphate isomerase/epimerase